MYVRDTDPLPPNSQTPSSECYDWGVCLQQSMAQSVANAKAASAQIAGPDTFRQFGPAVVIDVARSQNDLAATSLSSLPSPAINVSHELMAAPRVLPLNVTEEDYGGCCSGQVIRQPMPIARPQGIVMPQRAPAPVSLPPVGASPSAPKYKSLCWALRNGAVDASQFDPLELQALQYRCSQLGYTGACVPPPLIALWLDQQRRAGTLPHISVRQSDLDMIPQAPDLTGVNCPTSWAMGGMAGYRRGLGAPWGDAGSMPSTPGWQAAPSPGVSWKTVALLALAGAGLYAVARA